MQQWRLLLQERVGPALEHPPLPIHDEMPAARVQYDFNIFPFRRLPTLKVRLSKWTLPLGVTCPLRVKVTRPAAIGSGSVGMRYPGATSRNTWNRCQIFRPVTPRCPHAAKSGPPMVSEFNKRKLESTSGSPGRSIVDPSLARRQRCR